MIPVRDYLSLIAAHLHGLGRRVALLTVTLLVGIGLQLVTPQLIQGVIDGALSGRDQAQLLPLAGGVGGGEGLPPRSPFRSARYASRCR